MSEKSNTQQLKELNEKLFGDQPRGNVTPEMPGLSSRTPVAVQVIQPKDDPK
jgi:hypothetical protein